MPFDPKDLLALRPHLYNFCKKLAGVERAEDLCQDTLLKAWENASGFEEETNLKAWIFTIARNHHFSNNIRKKQHVYVEGSTLNLMAEEHLGIGRTTPQSILEASEVAAAINALPQSRRDALLAIAFGKSIKEYATESGSSEAAIKTRVSRARHELREQFGIVTNPAPPLIPLNLPIPLFS